MHTHFVSTELHSAFRAAPKISVECDESQWKGHALLSQPLPNNGDKSKESCHMFLVDLQFTKLYFTGKFFIMASK